VLLEHSDVSVPCNADAELITVVKSLHLDGKLQKQLGVEIKEDEESGLTTVKALGELITEGGEWQIFPALKPYPNEHAARQSDPSKYVRFGRQKDKGGEGVDFIFGVTKDGKTELQSVRFDRSKFSPEQAKAWLKEHKMTVDLEEAKAEEKQIEVKPPESKKEKKSLKDDCEDVSDSIARKLIALSRRDVDVADLTAEKEALDDRLDEADDGLLEEYEALKKKVNEALAGAAKSLAKREVKLMRPPPSVKVLYTPSDSDIIMGRIGEAVERALARKTGRLS
ncbi:MAG TPA: hypothetical protein PKZ08_12960, partial [Vicinamibacterales bacterium]|nr:hypothetical protein [Vicinamibacterales bacterium]